MKTYFSAAILAAGLVSGTALAAQSTQPTAAAPPQTSQPSITLDGSKAETALTPEKSKKTSGIICKRAPEIGSRLPGKKVCMTRAQYDERRMLDREMIEQAQASRPTFE